MSTIVLKDARDAPTGEELHKYRLWMERKVHEEGCIFVVTRTPPEEFEKRCLEEVWEIVDDRELLDPGEDWEEEGHQEEIEKHWTFNQRCPRTMEMKFE